MNVCIDLDQKRNDNDKIFYVFLEKWVMVC